jgi:hypothetical protein
MNTQRHLFTVAVALLAGLLAFSAGALAAKPPGAGNGGGSGGGGGGGSASPDLGDLVILYRDADGIPILTADSCQQPLAAPGVTLPAVGTIPECVPASATDSCVIPVDPATCGIVLGYETYTQEVEFGRTNVARSPASVFDQQLEDVIIRLATADCVTRDAAGRMVTSTDAGGVVTSAAIDSPLQNLAIYKQLMLTGYLGAQTDPIALPAEVLDIAAVGIGAASDKGGKVSVDMVVYLNQILGLSDEAVTTYLPKNCIDIKEEVKGVVQLVRKCFLDYGPAGGGPGGGAYMYDRGTYFGSLPDPAYIPAGSPVAGYSEYLGVLDDLVPTFEIVQGPTLDAVPELKGYPTLMASNIGGFAQAADDTRAVIEYLHSWPLPDVYATPLTCVASGVTTYDVSISDVSGLQVPVRMVSGTEGREFTLSVANAGPDAASGTVELEAVDANGMSIPTFPRTYSFTLVAGTSTSWTEGFSVDYKTTVTWTATADAPFDVNPANNSVTETTTVTGTGGGSSGGGGGGGGGRP